MSSMEYNKGVLIPTNIDTENFTEEDFETYEDEGFAVIDGEIYKVHWYHKGGELNGLRNVSVCDETGYISFETYHHNGGAHWTEIVESCL